MDLLINQLKNQELTLERVLQQGLSRAIVNYPAASSDSPAELLDRLLEVRTEPDLVKAINTAFEDDLVRKLLLDLLEDATVRQVNQRSADQSDTRADRLGHERETEQFDT